MTTMKTIDAMTPIALRTWLLSAMPGEAACYYRGRGLAADVRFARDFRQRPELEAIRECAQELAGLNTRPIFETDLASRTSARLPKGYFLAGRARQVDLVQRRMADDRTLEYLAVVRRDHKSRG